MTIPPFAHAAAVSYLIPGITAAYHWKKLHGPMKLFGIFCFYSVFHIVLEFILGRMGIPNQFLSNIYRLLLLECILFLYHQWTRRQILKNFFAFAGMAFMIVWAVDFSFTPFPDEFREHLIASANIVMLATSVVILQDMVRQSELSITKNAIFWISSGIILYSAGTMTVFTMSNAVLKMGIEYFNILWHINWLFTIIANMFFARSFQCKVL
jgi:hypothetical protein